MSGFRYSISSFSILRSQIDDIQLNVFVYDDNTRLSVADGWEDEEERTTLTTMSHEPQLKERAVFWWFPLSNVDPHAVSLGQASLFETPTGHPSVTELTHYWLRQCSRSHALCADNTSPTWYPTRLLDLSHRGIRLIETAAQHPRGAYATMSHCRGTKPFFVLTSDSLADIQSSDGIALSKFPQSF